MLSQYKIIVYKPPYMFQNKYSQKERENNVKKDLKSQKKNKISGNSSFEANKSTPNKEKSAAGVNRDYEYNHPTNAEVIRMSKTHIHIEKWFTSELPVEKAWDLLLPMLQQNFAVNGQSGMIEDDRFGKKWIYTNRSNQKMIVTLRKKQHFGSLRISKRISNWSPLFNGLLHGAYVSLIVTATAFAIWAPSALETSGLFILLWGIATFIITRMSTANRRKKQKIVVAFAEKIITSLADHS